MPTVPRGRLRGRTVECAAVAQTLDRVREGRTAVLVLRGEAGIGKSALIEYAVEHADGLRLLRAAGVESEMELPFASLHQLCAPLLDDVSDIPEPQREALDVAFGRRLAAPPDRFILGLALLNLLSAAAEREPLVCLIDDAQWLDSGSALVLGLVARRIRDVPVAMIFAERDGAELGALADLPDMRLEGLGDADARALLAAAHGRPLDDRVRDRIVAETNGNPLALLELPRSLGLDSVGSSFDLGLRLPSRIEASFRGQVAGLPPETQQLLLVAAAEPIGDPTLLWRAVAQLGIAVEAAAAAESAGLLDVGARIVFRHPLLRSAVYRAASPRDRRAVHAALGEVTDPDLDPDRRAWHRAQATLGPHEAVAEELELAAARAQVRGGFSAAAAFLERATVLTLDPQLRAARALACAQAKLAAGALDDAVSLLGMAESSGGLDPLGAARALLLHGQVEFLAGRFSPAISCFVDAAKRLETLDPALARDTYRDAFYATFVAGRLGGSGGTHAVRAAAGWTPQVDGAPEPQDLLLEGMAIMLSESHAAGVPVVRAALRAFCTEELSVGQTLDWLPCACHMALSVLDFESWDVLSERGVDVARNAGALAVLPIALTLRVSNRMFAGELDAASALNAEVEAVVDQTGLALMASYGAMTIAACRGRDPNTDEAERLAAASGNGQLVTTLQWARAMFANGHSRFDDAVAAAEPASAHPGELGSTTWALTELIEAAALGGDRHRAAAGLTELAALTQASGTAWALGTEALMRALVEEDAAEPHYREAITRLHGSGVGVVLARAQLNYGEWLRRQNRRFDAREHLRTAQELFAAMGFDAFADRAARSLRATGEKARRRTDDKRGELTAQEGQIAELARQGHSNPEIGARLFISPRTVEYHLAKVFTKLGVTSRTQLEQALPAVTGSAGAHKPLPDKSPDP
jgi:DNA-binding CsgD family transcriptional regulator